MTICWDWISQLSFQNKKSNTTTGIRATNSNNFNGRTLVCTKITNVQIFHVQNLTNVINVPQLRLSRIEIMKSCRVINKSFYRCASDELHIYPLFCAITTVRSGLRYPWGCAKVYWTKAARDSVYPVTWVTGALDHLESHPGFLQKVEGLGWKWVHQERRLEHFRKVDFDFSSVLLKKNNKTLLKPHSKYVSTRKHITGYLAYSYKYGCLLCTHNTYNTSTKTCKLYLLYDPKFQQQQWH